jgi:hypothetical protein
MANVKLQFSGHDSFVCKHLWLKKGYDYLLDSKSFSSESAVVDLGVGKNMVNAISYWLKSFGLIDEKGKPNELAQHIFGKRTGVDPYIENLGTIWLLHYKLVETNKASIYNLVFNQFRKGRSEFTKEQLLTFIKRLLDSERLKGFNANTVNTDIGVFFRSYLKPYYKESKIDIEEDFSSLLIDLDLISVHKAENAEGKLVDWYKIENKFQIDLPAEILLFSILDNPGYGKSISFKDLLTGYNSPGMIYAINEEGLLSKIEKITACYKSITFTESAGVRELQFRRTINKYDVLNAYYSQK